MNNTITLYFFEAVFNNSGIWDLHWFLTKEAARKTRKHLIKHEGFNPKLIGGEYHSISKVQDTSVE